MLFAFKIFSLPVPTRPGTRTFWQVPDPSRPEVKNPYPSDPAHKSQTTYHQVANHLISTFDENESRSKQTIQNTGYLVTPSSECYLVIAVATIWQIVRLSVPQKTNSLASLVHSSRENNCSSIHYLSFTSLILYNYMT